MFISGFTEGFYLNLPHENIGPLMNIESVAEIQAAKFKKYTGLT
jgi:hypothetical protein